MSKVGHYDFRCPKCRHSQKFTIWESVTAHLNPDLKSKILNGSFFQQRCGGCKASVELTHPVLYHDTRKRLAIWLCEGGLNREYEDAMDVFGMTLSSGYTLRIVYNLRELAETVAIFDADLNDWFVLMLKMSAAQQNRMSATDFVFCGFEPSEGDLSFEVSTLRGKQSATISGGANRELICAQWAELEEELDWIYTSEENFYTVFSAFKDRFD